MYIHIALFRWKKSVSQDDIDRVLDEVEALADKIPGIIEISCGENTSRYSEGYSHVVLVRGESQQAIDAYRSHLDHVAVASQIDDMEDSGIGVDFVTKVRPTP